MYIDVTKKYGSYTRELVKEMSKIRQMFYDRSVPFEDMRKFVHNTVCRAKATPARERFIGYLYDCHSKYSIDALCFNAIEKARHHKSY